VPDDTYFSRPGAAPIDDGPPAAYFIQPGPAPDDRPEWQRMHMLWSRQAGKSTIAAAFNAKQARVPTMSTADVLASVELSRMLVRASRWCALATVRTIYYRGSDCYRVVVLDAYGREVEQIGTFTEGGTTGERRAQEWAEQAAAARELPTSWIDVP
jgi:hypothetical protein